MWCYRKQTKIKTPILLPNLFILIHILYQKYLKKDFIYNIYEIADKTCYIENKYKYLACQIEIPFYSKFVSKIQFYNSEQNYNIVYLIGHFYLKFLSLDFIFENSKNAS